MQRIPDCHPDRVHYAMGMCHPCYERSRVNNLSDVEREEMLLKMRAYQKGRSAEARREQHLWQRYKLTPEDFVSMLGRQGGVCAICGDVMKKPCIDHDHETGKVRGILCSSCNLKLSGLESAEWEMAAKDYLCRQKETGGE